MRTYFSGCDKQRVMSVRAIRAQTELYSKEAEMLNAACHRALVLKS